MRNWISTLTVFAGLALVSLLPSTATAASRPRCHVRHHHVSRCAISRRPHRAALVASFKRGHSASPKRKVVVKPVTKALKPPVKSTKVAPVTSPGPSRPSPASATTADPATKATTTSVATTRVSSTPTTDASSTVATSAPAVSPPAPGPESSGAAVTCDLYASPSGSDTSGDGSADQPFASLQKLDQALRPGQTGCLRAGTYGSLDTWHDLESDGTASGQITISSYPGETATITGWVDLEGSYTTLENVRIDGSNDRYPAHPAGVDCTSTNMSQPLVIAGRNDILQYVDYFQSVASRRGNGIGVGFWGDADNTVIRYDKIHDVGSCLAYDHLIYLSHGNNVQIYDNWMWNDPNGRGVQLYPAPTNARIFDNVIDHAGEGFIIGDDVGTMVSGNEVYNNIVTNSTGLPSEGLPGAGGHDWYGGQPGQDNSFFDNDAYGNPGGVGQFTSAVNAYGNVTSDPQFVDAADHDYQLRSTSPDGSWGIWDGSLTVS